MSITSILTSSGLRKDFGRAVDSPLNFFIGCGEKIMRMVEVHSDIEEDASLADVLYGICNMLTTLH